MQLSTGKGVLICACSIGLTPRRCSYVASMGQGQMYRQLLGLVQGLMSNLPLHLTCLQIHRISSLLLQIHPCSKIVVSILAYGSSDILRQPFTGPTSHHTKITKMDQRQDIALRLAGWKLHIDGTPSRIYDGQWIGNKLSPCDPIYYEQ